MNQIPNFPDSKKLTLDDKDEIETFVRKFPPYSDYNFTSLYCYNVNDKVEVSWLNDNLVVLFQDYTSDALFYSFLGDNLVTETALTLLDHADSVGVKSELRLIPEHTINFLNGQELLSVHEDKDNHDYILSTNLLCTYQGVAFRNKKNLVNRFLKTHLDHETKKLDFQNAKTQEEIIELFNLWTVRKGLSTDEVKHELKAIQRFLKSSYKIRTIGTGIYIQNKMVAFMANEILHDSYAMIHFDKSDFTIEGISSYVRQVAANVFNENGCKHINYEQDLGITGLKEAKQQLRPTTYLRKFILTKNNYSTTA